MSVITAMHYCLPPGRLTNDELAQRFDPKLLASIVKMSGITERRIAAPETTASDLAFVAAQRLLAGRGLAPENIDLLVFVSQTGDHQIPATACLLHGRLGLKAGCAAFDLNLGCSGFPYGLAVVDGLIRSGVATKALLLNADTITHVIHPRDRGLVPLHGDGAVATLVEASAAPATGLLGVLLGTDGSGAQHLMIPVSGARKARSEETRREIVDASGSVRTDEHLAMNGPAIFHFSVYKIPEAIREALTRFGVKIEDLDLVILHQANKMMLELIYKSLGIPAEKRFYFMEQVGNMSGASTPMALAEAVRQGRVKPGSLTLLASFGVGLSWGVALIRWPEEGIAPIAASVEFSA
jgi:3-oxoacyl-[acyl-carrier-protein] synthase III